MKFFSLVILIMFPLHVFAAGSKHTSQELTASTTSTQVLDEHPGRCYMMVQNKGSESILVKTGSVHSGSEGVLIVAGGNWEPFSPPVGSVYIKSLATTSAITVISGSCW